MTSNKMAKLPNVKKEKERTPYWEAFKLDRCWQPPPRRKTTTKSTFGPQILSKRVTSPSFGFGTANRYAFNKMYLSAEMAKTKPGNFSPGPAYELISSFGKQPESHNESPPEIKIGTGSRWKKRKPDSQPGPGAYDSEVSAFGYQAKYGTQSPGPMVYGARTTFGPQAASKNRTAPVINFTKGQRTLVDENLQRTRDGGSAGPGEYPIKGSVGKQPESQKVTLPAFSFPHCSRDRMNKVFLSKEHDKAHYGETSPGPASFKQVSSMGNQPLSRCVNPPFIKFTKGTRWNRPPDDLSGPGTYDVSDILLWFVSGTRLWSRPPPKEPAGGSTQWMKSSAGSSLCPSPIDFCCHFE